MGTHRPRTAPPVLAKIPKGSLGLRSWLAYGEAEAIPVRHKEFREDIGRAIVCRALQNTCCPPVKNGMLCKSIE